MTIWFSASCSLTILPNSLGLPALPLRISSVDGSNRLKILPATRGLPPNTRARAWRHALFARDGDEVGLGVGIEVHRHIEPGIGPVELAAGATGEVDLGGHVAVIRA